MILKGEDIASLLEHSQPQSDPLVIRPEPNLAELKQSGAASVDLRLGAWLLMLQQTRDTALTPSDQTGGEVLADSRLTRLYYVPFGGQFVLHPRTFVLGVTLEWVRLPKTLAGYVIGRSSWGRRGLIIATATGVHPGFTGCLTLELSNVGEMPISIKPGLAICQLFLHETRPPSLEAVDRTAFLGQRRPTLGQVEPDEVAKKLAQPT